MLQFVPDRSHEVEIHLPRIDEDPEYSVWTHHGHREQQAGPDAVPALTLRDIDDAVRTVNLVDEPAKGRRSRGGFADDRHKPRTHPAHAPIGRGERRLASDRQP